ncbi:MAG: hypothetical protein AAGA30_00540 [Planctomycetota bacterium]
MSNKSYQSWWMTGSLILILIFAIGIFVMAGWVEGEEFCPDDFSRRNFSYNAVPLLGIVVRGMKYEDSTPVFEQNLFSDGFLGTPPPVKTWHLVSDSVSDNRSGDFDARFLCRILDITNEEREIIWIRWNEDFPKLAKKFWPLIADLARSNRYIDASKIMLQASSITHDDVTQFESQMNQIAADSFLNAATDLLQESEFKKAIPLFSKSINHNPTKAAYLGRSECYSNTGEAEKSLSDQEKANSLSGR